ncbi:hypothetical protein NQ317_014433 [Molorchus minor]|uniref:Rho-GAP domain-containing protein n=1 Tax=Molorchus minor TaxID=1323400 RepID=A0ABQ9K592_9CUCU|nr:hypothetical protein NQ317_014433 [Molorchus minor]
MCSTSNFGDESIIDRFKKDYAEQFPILVRMHLSFVLDLTTEEREWFTEKGKLKKLNSLLPFGRKLKNRGVMEGAPLTQEGICQVYQLIEFLRKEQTELSDPLLTEAHFPAYCQIAESCGLVRQSTQEGKLLEALQLLLLLLPNENKVLLKDLLDLLHLTASFESFNRMSPENLARLFTPHLLCPRKLSPEHLLRDSQTLFGIVSFMIKRSQELFRIPPKLIVEFRAKYEKKKILSPTKRLNESISDAASTVFTLKTALAQLYAHIQSMPESSKKRKLVKQFNKENGYGTPLQVVRSNMPKSKTLGDSIKKHIFQKGLTKKKGFQVLRSSSDEILSSMLLSVLQTPSNSPSIITRARLFCHNCDSSPELSSGERQSERIKPSSVSKDCAANECGELQKRRRSHSEPNLSTDGELGRYKLCMTSTPACLSLKACADIAFTPEEQDRKSMSPITRSTQRMTRAMQETMMTPRSRKPVLVLSGTNINTLHKIEPPSCIMDNLSEECSESSSESDSPKAKRAFRKSKSDGHILNEPNSQRISKINKTDTPTSITETFKEYLSNREMETLSSPVDLSFSSRTDDFDSTNYNNISDSKLTDSLLYCLNGNDPGDVSVTENGNDEGKALILKPKQFDKDGKPIVFETSF